jgi:hypothetical protein
VPEGIETPLDAPRAIAIVGYTSRTGRGTDSDRRTASRLWLWSTVLVTAGALITAILVAPPRAEAPARGLAWLLFIGSSVHVASTGWLYTVPDVRAYAVTRPARYIWIPIGLIAAGAVAAFVFSPSQLAWLLLPYFAWQFFHFQKQNLGIVALAASSHRVTGVRPQERKALMLAGGAGIVGLMARPTLLQIRINPGIGALFTVAAVVFAVAVGAGIVALGRRQADERPTGFAAVYVLSLFFSLPIFVFRSPYAAIGGMTVAHGLQYLLLVGLVAAGTRRGTTRMLRLALLGNIALVGGAALSAASHLHGAIPAVRVLFGAYLGAVMAHFVVDAGLWRLRDPFPRSFMGRHVPYLVPPRESRTEVPGTMDRWLA